MPDLVTLATEYRELIRASRQRQVNIDRETIDQVLALLEQTAQRLRRDLETTPRGILGARYKRRVEASITLHADALRADFAQLLNGQISAAAANAAQREAGLLSALMKAKTQIHPSHRVQAAFEHGSIDVEFGRVPAQVLDRLYARTYEDGLNLSQRLHRLDRDARQALSDEIFQGVASGASSRKIAASIAPILTQPGVDNVRYRAMRIARTEVNLAYREGHIAAVTDKGNNLKPWVSAIGWRLSPAHPRTDICDAWAGDDTEGLGAGNYSPGNLPPGHQNCLCFSVTILAALPDQQFVSTPPRPDDVSASQRKYYGATLPPGVSSPPPPGQPQAKTPKSKQKSATKKPAKVSNKVAKKGQPSTTPNPAKARRMILAKEKQIRPQTFESAYVVDENANVILDKNGQQFSVNFSPAEMAAMKQAPGAVLTHNHPRGWGFPATNPQRQGNSFSLADISLAADVELAEVRAATPTHNYSMKPGANGWNASYFASTIDPAYRKAKAEVDALLYSKVAKRKITSDEAASMYFHEIWKRVAKRVGLRYTRQKG